MEQILLKHIFKFSSGKNITRMSDRAACVYTSEDFERDLHNNNNYAGSKCIVNLIKSQAAPMSRESIGKEVTSNFLVCEFDPDILNPWYFCYEFNEGTDVEQQILKYHQGNTLSVKKLNIKIIGDLKIKLPDLTKQKIIGEMYRRAIEIYDLMLHQADNYRKLSREIIKKMEDN